MKLETFYLALFGLSMTLIMATVLFALVGLNPKMESYSWLPWIYSASSAVTAAGLWFWARHISRLIDKQSLATVRTENQVKGSN